jgi:hypothetical protein
MTPAPQADCGSGSSERTTPRLEDLIPIAVVIAAGCEGCAERMVQRALRRGSAWPIQQTLGIVAHLRSRDCFVQAVGAEVIARMEKPLEAGMKALRGVDPLPGRVGMKRISSTERGRQCDNRENPAGRENA